MGRIVSGAALFLVRLGCQEDFAVPDRVQVMPL